ncbi:hypothetical protein AGIG_G15417 [Arapaima gigas]
MRVAHLLVDTPPRWSSPLSSLHKVLSTTLVHIPCPNNYDPTLSSERQAVQGEDCRVVTEKEDERRGKGPFTLLAVWSAPPEGTAAWPPTSGTAGFGTATAALQRKVSGNRLVSWRKRLNWETKSLKRGNCGQRQQFSGGLGGGGNKLRHRLIQLQN